MAVKKNAPLQLARIGLQGRFSPDKVTEHGSQPQVFVVTRKHEMGQEVHRASVTDSGLSGLLTPGCVIMSVPAERITSK